MAPELALEKITALTVEGQTVLDPMCGSGTVVRLARESQRDAIGTDLDPLAVLMTRTACNPAWAVDLSSRAAQVVREAESETNDLPAWMEEDADTRDFAAFWFGRTQRVALARIAKVLIRRPISDDPLRIALSRVIVTKDGGASLARDTSHSRPHRVRVSTDYDVMEGFVKSATKLEKVLAALGAGRYESAIQMHDARALSFVDDGSIDLVVTSPPYLNAIDYLRGHRMSLVWFGYSMSEIRALRGSSIGAERMLRGADEATIELARQASPQFEDLSTRHKGLTLRFVHDMQQLCASVSRVVKANGHLVFVVADSTIRGVAVRNSEICKLAAKEYGFDFVEGAIRPLPSQHRYLPPPDAGSSTFSSRMREEAVLTFRRVGGGEARVA